MIALFLAAAFVGTAPQGIHQFPGADYSSQGVSWYTSGPVEPVVEVEGVGQFQGYSESWVALGESHYHHVELYGLAPDTSYTAWIEPGHEELLIRTWPENPEQVRVAWLADTSDKDYTVRLLEQVVNMRPHLLVIGGDWGYWNYDRTPCKEPHELGKDRWWWEGADDYFDVMETAGRYIPIAFILGNHEQMGWWSCGEWNIDGPLARVHMPGNEEHFTIRLGPVVLTAVNTNERFRTRRAREQATWLDDALGAQDRDPSVVWSVVGGHHPVWGTRSENLIHVVGSDILEAHQKTVLYLAGHLHRHERLHPILGEVYQPPYLLNLYRDMIGPAYIISGGGGGRSVAGQPFGTEPYFAHQANLRCGMLFVFDDAKVSAWGFKMNGAVFDWAVYWGRQ